MRIHDTEQMLSRLRGETDCHAQNYETVPPTEGGYSDPVAAYHAKVERLEQTLRKLQEETEPVQRVREFLKCSSDVRDSDMLFVLELYYFERMRMEEVALHLQRSVKTLTRRRQDLIGLVIFELEHS